MARRPTKPRYYPSRRAYYVQVGGRQILLAKGDRDDPEVVRKAWERFREVVPARASRVVAITEEEASGILRQAEKNPLGYVLFLLRWTGCRPAEVCTVSAEQVDENAQTLRVGGRVIPSGMATRLLSRFAKRYPTGSLFRNRRDKPWTVDAIHGGFCRLRDRCGLRKELTPFSYRHAFALRFLAEGGSFIALALVLGISEKQARRLYGGVNLG